MDFEKDTKILEEFAKNAKALRELAEKKQDVDYFKNEFEKLPPIIAVDFDGCLAVDNWPGPPEIPNKALIEHLIGWKKRGTRIILWTCRLEPWLTEAVEFCKKRGLEFDEVNENIPEVRAIFGKSTRKVYANEYIDDKGVRWRCPLKAQ